MALAWSRRLARLSLGEIMLPSGVSDREESRLGAVSERVGVGEVLARAPVALDCEVTEEVDDVDRE